MTGQIPPQTKRSESRSSKEPQMSDIIIQALEKREGKR